MTAITTKPVKTIRPMRSPGPIADTSGCSPTAVERHDEDADQDQCGDEEHYGERRSELEIEDRAVLLEDQHRRHVLPSAAQDARRHVGADRKREDDQGAGDDAGAAQRKSDPPERTPRSGTEVARRIVERA